MNTYKKVVKRIEKFNPSIYAKTRNFVDGGISKLSPYISRGVISTNEVSKILLNIGYKKYQLEKFFQELAWRDYWQKKWQLVQNIDVDLKNEQKPVFSYKNPKAVTNGNTSISAINKAVSELYSTGYMHNHLRMYTASICCNVGKYHWLNNARWMYYHLIDGDWGSNALSWQWVAGTNSHKKYYANQNNINKYCHTNDKKTFLDYPYEVLTENNEIPNELLDEIEIDLKTKLPEKKSPKLNPLLPIIIYTTYNLDPNWLADINANRVLLLEPKHFEKYPVSEKVLNFILELSKDVSNIQVLAMDFDEFYEKIDKQTEIIYKEHPFCNHFNGNKVEREWLFPDLEATGSFFNYWNKGLKKHKIL
mgnify:FL=1